MNLLLNAVQAMPDGGTLKVETETTETAEGKRFLELLISDTGQGIEASDLKKYSNLSIRPRNADGAGTGHRQPHRGGDGGKHQAGYTLEQGTTFRIRLPLPEHITGRP